MSTTIANYEDWNLLYVNALLEPDSIRLHERIIAAEAAINQRLNVLVNRQDSEKAALLDALRALQRLRARRNRTWNLLG